MTELAGHLGPLERQYSEQVARSEVARAVAGFDRGGFAGVQWSNQGHSNPTDRPPLSNQRQGTFKASSAEPARPSSKVRPARGRCITVGRNRNRVHYGPLHLAMNVRGGS